MARLLVELKPQSESEAAAASLWGLVKVVPLMGSVSEALVAAADNGATHEVGAPCGVVTVWETAPGHNTSGQRGLEQCLNNNHEI